MVTNRIWGSQTRQWQPRCLLLYLPFISTCQLIQPIPPPITEHIQLLKCFKLVVQSDDCFYGYPHWFFSIQLLLPRWKITQLRDLGLVRGHSKLGWGLPLPKRYQADYVCKCFHSSAFDSSADSLRIQRQTKVKLIAWNSQLATHRDGKELEAWAAWVEVRLCPWDEHRWR